ncbi:SurA N-terminal domain-containing protein [Streptomyces niger]|uniref:SurA N-terminal domain-containing protein n=1 Tax=Streptomyces niger TaxID=66373 RepID=UPI00069A350A|nr:SurA N-terminal domain-containing protein [Streptomyces niger]
MLRRRTALSVSVAALVAAPLLSACGSDAHPGAAAVVGGERITVAQLQARVKNVRTAQEGAPQGAQMIQNTGRLSVTMLNSMIFDKVLARGAKDAGVEASRSDVQKWRSTAEQRAGGAEQLKAMSLQQAIAPGEIDGMARNQILMDGLAKKLGANRQTPQGQQKLAQSLAKTSRQLGIDVNPRFGTWNDRQVTLGEAKTPWVRTEQKQQA